MGLARAAELNGYPGPAHVLEAARAGKIDLYAEQREAIDRIHTAMKAKARALGREILAQEASLEAGFRTGHVVDAELARQVEEIGRKAAELRLTHLRAHVLTAAILRPEQIEEYYQFRGIIAPSQGHVPGH
jgi:Spy/CpxP family protein refolding chaperone